MGEPGADFDISLYELQCSLRLLTRLLTHVDYTISGKAKQAGYHFS
jgi:hypothetical protein